MREDRKEGRSIRTDPTIVSLVRVLNALTRTQ